MKNIYPKFIRITREESIILFNVLFNEHTLKKYELPQKEKLLEKLTSFMVWRKKNK